MKQATIAIVGGGANGVATFLHLVLKLVAEPLEQQVKLVLLEKNSDFGPGLAYGTQQRGHLLNTPAGLMGIFAEERMHFVEWLQENSTMVKEQFPEAEIHAYAYLPRCLYGTYLKEQLDAYRQLARRHNLEVALLKEEATDATVTDDKVTLVLKSGARLEADIAILATGTPKPNNFPHLNHSPHYFDFPWPSGKLLQNIPKEAPVALLGTSLTAIDTVITLMDNGHTGHLTLYSRHGLLPRIQTPFDVPFERKHLTLENIRKLMREEKRELRTKDLFRLFRQDAERVMGPQNNWKAFNRTDKPHQELLQHDFTVALAGKSVFQKLAVSTRYLSFPVWKLLTADEKVHFLKWFGPHWDINRHSMPITNAHKILALLQKGQLTIKGGSSEVNWEEGEERFLLHLADGTIEKSPFLINATGTAKDVEKMDIPLLQNLLRNKFLQPHPAGGVFANPDSLRLYVPAQPKAPLYGVGQLLVGELFDTNAVWFNVACIDQMTNHILRSLKYGYSA
ncbi:FAD/NAD(P)-binding protein [Pontibacter beigongshangensis]|uniref:FAD/NAD(P)-binding protein n=1 Tax=Pontibacter beigongshangensis TaxID=2574733 RepID=UPI001650AE3D|nr:FAD/NAD(P)-binding protein [Pontibacter beigongshangensis]